MIEGFEKLTDAWTLAWEKNTSRAVEQTFRNQKVLEQVGRAVSRWSTTKIRSNQILERWMTFFRLPTRSDLVQTLYGLHQVDMRLVDVSDQLARTDLRLAQMEEKLEKLESATSQKKQPTRNAAPSKKGKGDGK